MKKNIFLSLITLMAGSLLAADSNPKDAVASAAGTLSKAPNFSWHAMVTSAGAGSQFTGPSDGKSEKGGNTWISIVRSGNTILAVFKGTNGAINTPDNGWQSFKDVAANDDGGFNPMTFLVRVFKNYKTPDLQAATLANQAVELKLGTNGISADLTEAGAKEMLTFGQTTIGGNALTVSNAKGSVTFWVTDGKLVKYQFFVGGTVTFNGNDRDIDRTTTVDISDVGTTKVSVPDEAKKIME